MESLTWNQVHTWRLTQQCLQPRLQRRNWLQAVTRTQGIQAQVMSAAELAIWARADGVKDTDISSALWTRRTLVKTWVMRGTLHLLEAKDLPLQVAARSLHNLRNFPKYFAAYGFTPAQHRAYLEAVPHVLGDKPMTRAQLAAALAKYTGVSKFREFILGSSWGAPLMESAFRGELCFGPSQGQNVTFVNPRKWLAHWKTYDPEQALLQIARRFLAAYGPANPQDFGRWWFGGFGLAITKKLFQTLRDELEEVDVEGWHAFVLRPTLSQLQETAPTPTVCLLPMFDAYTFALSREREAILPKAYMPQVFRPQGWISAVVLHNGQIRGVWNYKIGRQQTDLSVRLFTKPTPIVRKGITAEAERLGEFLNSKVVVSYDR